MAPNCRTPNKYLLLFIPCFLWLRVRCVPFGAPACLGHVCNTCITGPFNCGDHWSPMLSLAARESRSNVAACSRSPMQGKGGNSPRGMLCHFNAVT